VEAPAEIAGHLAGIESVGPENQKGVDQRTVGLVVEKGAGLESVVLLVVEKDVAGFGTGLLVVEKGAGHKTAGFGTGLLVVEKGVAP
jgi:hypothetical protein